VKEKDVLSFYNEKQQCKRNKYSAKPHVCWQKVKPTQQKLADSANQQKA